MQPKETKVILGSQLLREIQKLRTTKLERYMKTECVCIYLSKMPCLEKCCYINSLSIFITYCYKNSFNSYNTSMR